MSKDKRLTESGYFTPANKRYSKYAVVSWQLPATLPIELRDLGKRVFLTQQLINPFIL